MSARVRATLFALLALTAAIGPLATAGAPVSPAIGQASADQTTATATETALDRETTIYIKLESDGDARWTITANLDVSNEEERDAFRELADRYESGRMATPWIDQVRAANEAAERATGRSMAITGVDKSSNVTNATLSVQFTWTEFAREEGDHAVVDDAFNTTSGTWLDGLSPDQRLVIELPEGHGVQASPEGANPSFDKSASISWNGPQEFEPGYMYIQYSGDAPTPNDGPVQEWLLGGFFVVGLGIFAAGLYVISQRRGTLELPKIGDSDGSDAPAGAVSPSAPSDDGNARQTATAGTVEPDTEEATDDVDEELLSDEERVELLLERNGGRMKQASIVKETEWSNAKVSQLLSSMADVGTIDKLRIGRENLISFPDEDVTDVDQD